MSVFSHKRRQFIFSRTDEDEGPYVSFADLMFGVIFLFLILIAALLIAQKHIADDPSRYEPTTTSAMSTSADEIQALEQQSRQLQTMQTAMIAEKTSALAKSTNEIEALEQQLRQLRAMLAATVAEKASEVRESVQPSMGYREADSTDSRHIQQLTSEISALKSENASLQSQLASVEEEKLELGSQLSAAVAALSKAQSVQTPVEYATKLFSYNDYQCPADNCATMHYLDSDTLYRTGPSSYITSVLSSSNLSRPFGPTDPMSRADVDSRSCSDLVSRNLLEVHCVSSYGGERDMRLVRSGPNTYEGEGTASLNGNEIRNLIRWEIIEIDDPSLQ